MDTANNTADFFEPLKLNFSRRLFLGSSAAVSILLTLAATPISAAPVEVAPVVGYANWWHVDRVFPTAQAFCDAMQAAGGAAE